MRSMRFAFFAAIPFALSDVGLAQVPLHTLPCPFPNTNGGLGLGGIAAIGDVDQDGVPDVAVTAKKQGQPRALIYSGASGAFVAQIGVAPGGGEPSAIGAAGDLDGDGVVDVAVGMANFVKFYSGSGGAGLGQFTASAGTPIVDSIAPVGDVDQDGFADVAAGWSGAAYVISGATHQSLLAHVGTCSGAVARGPDVDGDGVPEIALGDILVPSPANTLGVVHFVTLGDVEVATWSTEPGQEELTRALVNAGDVDGDGFDEVAAGSWSGGATIAGRVDVFSAKLGQVLWTRWSPQSGPLVWDIAPDHFALSLAGGGDVDGDGTPDLVVGAEDSTLLPGAATGAYVLDGADGHLLNLPIVEGVEPSAQFGHRVAMLGDLDGDGRSEVGATAPNLLNASLPFPTVGTAFVFACGPSQAHAYGTGCPGSAGHVPQLAGTIGGGAISLTVTQALGGAPVLFALGPYPAKIAAGGQCSLGLAPLAPVMPMVVASGGGPGAGTAAIGGALPAGLEILLSTQAFVADPGVPLQYCATPGLQLAIH